MTNKIFELATTHPKLEFAQSWNFSRTTSKSPIILMCDASHTKHKNQMHDHDAFNISTNLANKHDGKVFLKLKSMSCLRCDFDVIGFFTFLQIAKADNGILVGYFLL